MKKRIDQINQEIALLEIEKKKLEIENEIKKEAVKAFMKKQDNMFMLVAIKDCYWRNEFPIDIYNDEKFIDYIYERFCI